MKRTKKIHGNWCKIYLPKSTINVGLDDREIVAAHTIPGIKGKPRPIIVKVANTNIKARVMRKRSVIKQKGNGLKLVDEVTRPNQNSSPLF